MQAHERHFSITAIYKMNPSPLAFFRLQAIVIVKIYIVGWFYGGHGPYLVALMGIWWQLPLEIHN
jgi:hypothetical protein